jgi:ABC-2 type transport system ATP-binding protein
MAGTQIGRVDEVLVQTGIADAADRRVGGYSLGMRQRLALATALLGNPRILLLDEPANGLDPGGIAWLREFLRWFAADGGTVLISSHVLSEVAQTVDDVLIIAQGRLVKAASLAELVAGTEPSVVVVTPTPDLLLSALRARHIESTIEPTMSTTIESDGASPAAGQAIVVRGLTAAEVGDLAHSEGIRLHQLTDQRQDLEDVFLRLVEEPPG